MDETAERVAINTLLNTYTINGDRGRVEALAEVFAEDGVLQTPTFRAEGRKGIIKALSRDTGTAPPPREPGSRGGVRGRMMRHHLTSSLVEFDGPDSATARSYWINYTEHGPDHSGLYADKIRRIDGRWRIVHRDVRLDWIALDSRQPAGVASGPAPAGAEVEIFRG
jgi:hypothetical protein